MSKQKKIIILSISSICLIFIFLLFELLFSLINSTRFMLINKLFILNWKWLITWISFMLIFTSIMIIIFLSLKKQSNSNFIFKEKWNIKNDTLKSSDTGFVVGSNYKTNEIKILKEKHLMIVGTTGSGKTSKVVIPSILQLGCTASKPTLIISDLKGELFNNTSKPLKNNGYQIYKINLRDLNATNFWNPFASLQKIKDNTTLFLNELQTIVDFIFDIGKDNSFWNDSAKRISYTWLKKLILCSQKLITADVLISHFNNLMKLNRSNLEKDMLNSSIYDFVCGSPNTKAAIFQNIIQKLSIFQRPIIERIISHNEIDLVSSLEQPTAIFIDFNIETKYELVFVSLLISELTHYCVKYKPPNKQCYFILDEFGNIPGMEIIFKAITYLRSYKTFFMFIVQDTNQIELQYNSFATKIFTTNCANLTLDNRNKDMNNVSVVNNKNLVLTLIDTEPILTNLDIIWNYKAICNNVLGIATIDRLNYVDEFNVDLEAIILKENNKKHKNTQLKLKI